MKKRNVAVGAVIFAVIGILLFIDVTEIKESGQLTQSKLENVKRPSVTINETLEQQEVQKTIPISFNQSIQESAQIVAHKYEQTLKFPPYSQPLSLNDFSLINPNYFEPVTMVTQDSNVQISMVLDKYHFVAPEAIKVQVIGSDIYGVKLKVQDADTRKTLSSHTMQFSQDRYVAQIKGSLEYPANLQITALANVNGDEIPLVAQINYNQKSATIIGGAKPFVENADLVFPIKIQVEKAGLYRVRANLFSGLQPIASLVSETKLEVGQKQALLRAHHSVLPSASEFELATFTIEKRSTHPAEPSRFGNAEIEKLVFENVDLSGLERSNYQPKEIEKKRLAFLKSMKTNN